MKAICKGTTVAESTDIVTVEGNAYFPDAARNAAHFRPSEHRTVCGWKGTAHYYHVVVDGEQFDNAAWYYPEPKPEAAEIRGRVAFWGAVTVEKSA